MQIAWRSPSMVRIVGSATPADAAALGLRFVHQELNIVPSLSVAENILLSRHTPRRFGMAVDWAAMRARAAEALARFGIDHIDVTARAGSLSTGDRMLTVLAGSAGHGRHRRRRLRHG
jgi:ribose transport system ATP-binding protein